VLARIAVESCLEIGCGTGKNTQYLMTKATRVTAIDLSTEMLAKAKQKIRASHVRFQQADITGEWDFADGPFELVSFSLVLEHIADLDAIFKKVAAVTASGGHVYVGELHPFKQYAGTKARFDTAEGQQIVTCYTHHLSDFLQAAKQNGFVLADVNEYFDGDDRTTLPRILSILLRKP
jgi:ubiquinone/menaquinone biosynthesis C-methylase UbiE